MSDSLNVFPPARLITQLDRTFQPSRTPTAQRTVVSRKAKSIPSCANMSCDEEDGIKGPLDVLIRLIFELDADSLEHWICGTRLEGLSATLHDMGYDKNTYREMQIR